MSSPSTLLSHFFPCVVCQQNGKRLFNKKGEKEEGRNIYSFYTFLFSPRHIFECSFQTFLTLLFFEK